MKVSIKSAELVKYNANARGKNVGDCVKRSISLAFDLTYTETGKLLNAKMKEVRAHAWNTRNVFDPVIRELGGIKINMTDSNITVGEFADTIAGDNETLIVLCGKKWPETSHMVCIRNHQIWDSWDCNDYIVHYYYLVKGQSKPITNIKDSLIQLCKDYASSIIEDEVIKYMNKKAWEGEWSFKAGQKDYSVKYNCYISLDADEIISKRRDYSFVIALVFQPTMTDEEAIDYITKTAKTRAYDRMYAIDQQEKKLIEAALIKQKAGVEGPDYAETHYLTSQEERFLNSLPGWVRPLVTYLDIQNPGMYSDSYRLTIRKLPNDNKHLDVDKIEFEGIDANEIKQEIYIYKDELRAPFLDYYPADEF